MCIDAPPIKTSSTLKSESRLLHCRSKVIVNFPSFNVTQLLSFYFSQLATLGALEQRILPLQNVAAVQPKEQPAGRAAPFTKENLAFEQHFSEPSHLAEALASHPPIPPQHSSPAPTFVSSVTHPGLALPRQPPRPSSSPLQSKSSWKQPVVKNRALVIKR